MVEQDFRMCNWVSAQTSIDIHLQQFMIEDQVQRAFIYLAYHAERFVALRTLQEQQRIIQTRCGYSRNSFDN